LTSLGAFSMGFGFILVQSGIKYYRQAAVE
jgi:hypothetical protein